MSRAPELDPATWVDRLCRLVATVLPFGLALARAASAGQWRDDVASVRDLGLVAIGIGGGLSTLAAQALGLVPLGPRSFRAALASALALAVAARLLYALVRRLLLATEPASRRPRLASALACTATLTAALSPTWQREATIGGGAMLATAAALAATWVALEAASSRGPSARAWIAVSALIGAAAAECPPAGLAAAAAVAAVLFARTASSLPVTRPSPRVLTAALAATALTAAVLLAPAMLRPYAPRGFMDLGATVSASSLSALDVAGGRTTALSAWTREVGLVSFVIAGVGAALALFRTRSRWLFAPLAAFLVLDTVLPARVAGVLAADPLTPLRSLAVAALAAGSALGVHEAVAALLRYRLPMAQAAATLLVVFHVTLVALTSEEAGFAADRSRQMAAEAWTDEAFGSLEPNAALLVRSPAVVWRLWAARITRGERPDVLVVPVPLLDRGRVAAGLVAAEPEVEALLRDHALTRAIGEFSLSRLADVRPLHVELDPEWPRRLVSHLLVDGLWLEFAPQPLGPSDRKLGAAASLRSVQRTLSAVHATEVPDASTASVVAETLRSQAGCLVALGERDAAQAFLSEVARIAPQDPFVMGGGLRFAMSGLRQAALARQVVRAR